MDFAAMKRRELQALCKRHGLAAGGTNADLVARLAATLSGCGGAAEEAIGVVVGKGCLKRSAGGASGGDLDAAKKVTFELEEDEEAEVGVTGRGRRRSQVMSSPAVAKTRGRRNAREVPPGAEGNGGERRRTRSQAGGDSADESDSGEAGADAPVRQSVTRKNSAKAEQGEVDVGDAAGRKHQLKRKTRENDIEDVDVSVQVGVSRRSTRSSSHLLEPDALSSSVEKKRGRMKAADVKEKTCVEEQPTEALHSGRTLRSGLVVVAPVPPIVSESKKSRWKAQEEEPAVEKVAKVEISGRTTRSSSVAAAVSSPRVTAKKRGRKTDDVHSDGGPDKKMENKRQSSRLTTRSSIHHLASSGEEEASLEQDAAPSKGLPQRRSRRNPSESNLKLNSNTSTENSNWSRAPTEGNGLKIARPTMLNATKDGVEDGVEKPDRHVGLKMSKLRNVSATVATNGGEIPFSVSSSKASATDMQIEVPGPVRRSTRKSVVPSSLENETNDMHEDVEKKQTVTKPVGRSTRRSVAPVILEKESKGLSKEMVSSGKASATDMLIEVPGPVRRLTRKSVVPSSLEHEANDMHEDVEKKQTVTKPVGRSTRRSVAPVILEKESKGLTKEMVPEAHVKRPTRKSVVPAMLEKGRKSIVTEVIPEARVKRSTRKPALPIVDSENNDHCEVVSTENLQSDKSEELEKQPTVKQPVKRLTRKSAVPAMLGKDRKGPDMLNNENGDRTEMQSDQVGHLEKQLVVKEHVRRSTGKSVVPDVIEKEKKGLHEELKSEVSVRTPVCKSVVPHAVNKENKDHNEFVRREELSVKTRSAHRSLQVASQNDESLRRTTRQSSRLVLSPPQTKPTASKGRPAKRRRTVSLQESMPAEEQKEDHTNDVIEVATSTDLEIGVLPFTLEKSDLLDSQLNSELESMVVVEPGLSRDKDDSDILECELEGTVGTTEKPPSNLPILDCQHVGALSEEAVHSIENDAGRCSPTGLQFLVSQGIAERSATHNAIPCPENSIEESDVHKVECRVETVVSSKSDSYHGSDENSVRVEESGGCTFTYQQNNEQEGHSVSSCPKDLVASAQLDLSEDADHVVRDVITKDLICKEEEKKDFIPSSDINVPHEISPANKPAENASGVSGAVFCISQSTPISDEVNSDSSRLESPDALDNRIAFSNTEAVHQNNKEEFNLHNRVTHGIHASGMSEAAQVEVSKSEKMLLPDVETSAFRDAQLNRVRKGNEFEEHSFSCGNDGSGKNNMSQLANEYVDSCREQELKLPHDLSAVKTPEGSTTCQDEFVIGSGIGRTSGSIVKGNSISMDAPGTVMQGDNLSPSATALLRNRENTPACKIDAPELSSDRLFAMDSSARAVQSVSGRLREAGLAVDNPDNKLRMEQVQQDDVQVLEGTLENTAVGSATPKSNQQCGLSEEAGPHSFKKICSSSVEQSPFGLQSLFSQDDVHVQDGTLEKATLGSATPECKHECGLPDEAEPHSFKKEICSSSVEQTPFGLQSLFSQDVAHVQEGTLEKAALGSVTPECKHECGLPDEAEPHSSKNERCSTSVEQSPFGLQPIFLQESIEEPSENVALAVHAKNGVDESKNIHVDYGVEKLPVPESVSDHDSSVDFSAVSKSEDCSYTSDQGLTKSCHEQEQMACQVDLLEAANCMDFTNPEEVSYDEENKKHVHSTYISSSCEKIDANGPVKRASGLGDGLLSSSMIASTDGTDVHPSSNPSQFESTDFLDEPKGCSSTEELQQGLKEQCDEPKENQVTYGACPSDMIEADTAKDLESEVPPLPAEEMSNMLEYLLLRESSKGSDMHGDLVLPSAKNEDDSNTCHVELQVERMVSSEPESSKGSDMHGDLVLPSAENEDVSIVSHVALQVEKMVSSEPDSHLGSHEDLTIVEGIRGCMFSSQLEHEKDEQLIAPLLAAETSALPDEQANPELEAGEFEKCNFSSEDTSGKFGTGYVENNLFQLHEDSRMDPIQGKELPDDIPAPKSPEQSTIVQDAETSALPDEQPNPELEGGEVEERNFCSEDKSGIFGTGYVKNNLFQLHEGSRVIPIQGKELPDDLDAPRSLEQSTIGQDAETSTLPDEQPNPELEGGEVEERNFSSEDTSDIFGTGYVKNNLIQLHEDSRMYPIQEKELPDDLDAPKSLIQSRIGPDAETSALPDEQPNPELEGGEFEERNFRSEDASGIFGTGYMEDNLFQLHEYSHMYPIQGKELPNCLHAPKSPEQSTIGRDDNVLGSETSPLPDEKFDPELEREEFKEHNHSCDKAASDIFYSGSVKNNTCHWDDKEEYNEHNDDRATAAMLSSGTTKSTLIEGSESGMALLSAAGTPTFTDDLLSSKLEDDKEQNLCFDTDTSNISDTGLMENSNLFSFPDDARTETCYEHELPIGTPAAKSVGESAVCPDGSVSGSAGICQTSGRRRVDEISTKLLRFKISSTVKGSYIATDSANMKQGDNLSPFSLLGNTENVPAANPDHHAELNAELSAAKDSSRQGNTDGL